MPSCKICTNFTSHKLQDTKAQQNYFFCPQCSCYFLEEKHYLQHQKEQEHYEKHENSIENKGYVKMFENFLQEAFWPFFKKEMHVLDYGCGHTPVLAQILTQKQVQVNTYDKFFFPQKPNKQYDFILSTEVFEHFHNPKAEIEKLLSFCTQHAYLAIMTQQHPLNDEAFLKWYYRRDITHVHFYHLKTFEYLAKSFNLSICYNNNKNICVFKRL